MKNQAQFALLSVSNKEGILRLAETLIKHGIRLIATRGTYQHLLASGIDVIEVSELTQFPEMMDGRVKSLHPKIFGGILGKRDIHAQDALNQNIPWINWVIVN